MKQKFDVFVWNEVTTNGKIAHPKGQLRLRLSQPAPLYIEAEGVEALAGYASDFDLEVSEAVTFRVEAAKGVRAFLYNPLPTSTVAEGEVFTNVDRMPHESGMMAEVTRARRMFEIERRQALDELRRETAIMRAQVKAAKPKKADPAAGITEGDGNVLPADDNPEALGEGESK